MNPFRRSSPDANSTPSSRPDPSGATAVPLSVNTRVPNFQKHVEFASPPAIPISPASYPSSPESTRQSPAFRTVLPSTPDYSDAIQEDPFQEDALADEDDVAIEQALQNARTNSQITTSKAVQRDAVKDTLSRFASGPKRSLTNPEVATDQSKSQKQALDVDAFKRLLLTGERAAPVQLSTLPSQPPTQLASDNSSTTDTASLSQRSILEPVPQTIEETPRSSIDQETSDGDAQRSQGQEARRRPPPPKPRYGKPISETTGRVPKGPGPSTASASESSPYVSAQAPTTSTETFPPLIGSSGGLDPSEVKKRPPTPPLTRRKSQNKTATRPGIERNTSSRYSITSSSADEPLSPNPIPATPGKMQPPPPPPPPTRRINSQSARKVSADLPMTEEEDDAEAASIDRVSVSSKRISLIPPPRPPPRRNRGSSRSSVDSQQPPVAAQLGMTSSARTSGEYRRPSNASTESRNVSGASNATDILADLAALRKEVDAARGSAGR